MIIALCSELLHRTAIRKHGVKLRGPSALGREHQMHAVGRPVRIFVAPGAMCKLYEILSSYVHYKNVKVPRLKSTRPRKRDVLAIRVPSRVDRVPFPSSQAAQHPFRQYSFYIFAECRRARK